MMWLLKFSALGEMAVGLALATWPAPVTGLLLGAPVAGTGATAARLGGIAVAALGAAWWTEQDSLDRARLHRLAPSFLGYNLGVALLFVIHAWSADRVLPIAWGVAAVHLATAAGYTLACRRPARASS